MKNVVALPLLLIGNALLANSQFLNTVPVIEELVVDTLQGRVKGHVDITGAVYEFYGIPYAIAPTGKDKFKAPLEPAKRNETFDANLGQVKCTTDYDEQCLVANIFKPNNNLTSNPVVVYIHGGDFSSGFGNQLKPNSLSSKGIVAVTFNYRLGPLGFLCLQTESVPGNAGLKDQLAALRWIRDNIANFGGNNKNITLAGYDSGAASAELLMLSDAAKNLFQKVILESGSATASWALDKNPLKTAQDYAKLLQIQVPNMNNKNVLSDLYTNMPTQQLFSKLLFDRIGQPTFRPCVEAKLDKIESVITEEPIIRLEKNNYTKLPIMLGYTNAEGLMFLTIASWIINDMNNNFTNYFPFDDSIKSRIPDANKVKEFYFNNETINLNKFPQFVRYMTDAFYSYPIARSARYHANNYSHVYLYEFDYVDSENYLGLKDIGAGHCAQTQLVLDAYNFFHEEDLKMWKNTINLWSNFINKGNPTSDLWLPLNTTTMNYLSINTTMASKTKDNMRTVLFWDSDFVSKASNAPSVFQPHLVLYFALLFNIIKLILC